MMNGKYLWMALVFFAALLLDGCSAEATPVPLQVPEGAQAGQAA